MPKNKYHVISCYFSNWNNQIINYAKIPCVNNVLIPRRPNHYIIPLDLRDREMCQNDKRMIFKMDIKHVEMLNNKCLFAKFMMEHYPENIPNTIIIVMDQINYIDPNFSNTKPRKMIKKYAFGCAGIGITIMHRLDENIRKQAGEQDFIISDYIDHTEYYTGHFLVHKGKILKHIIFHATTQDENYIKKGSITNYKPIQLEQIKADTRIFERIFNQLNYSGFACPDFIVLDSIIKIFEINPRPGGSLIANKQYCEEFFNTIITMQLND